MERLIETRFREPTFSVLLLCFTVALQVGFCQSKENAPIPEYYGIYTLVQGKLVKLDSQKVQADRTVRVRLGQRNGVGNILNREPVASSNSIDIPVFSSDFKIIVFSQPSGFQSPLDIAKTLHLESLTFIRNVTVDTGFPSNVRRSGAENGWDSGGAPELLGVANGDRAKPLEFLVKPVSGHADMVVAVLPGQLEPGVYRFSVGHRDSLQESLFGKSGLLFAIEPVSDAEVSKCVDAVVTYSMNFSNSKYSSCSGTQRQAADRSAQPGEASPASKEAPDSSGAPTSHCGDYDACIRSGKGAFQRQGWQQAIEDFQAASNQRSAMGEPRILLGRAYIAAGQTGEATQAWDKALSLGSAIDIGVCHTRTMLPCERGVLSISTASVSFNATGRDVFTASPSEATAKGTMNLSAMGHVSFGLEVQRKKYYFDFIPYGVDCQVQLDARCPQAGMAQQLIVANFISRTIPKLSSGEFSPAKADSPVAATGAHNAPGSEVSSPIDSSSAVGLWINSADAKEHFEIRAGGAFVDDEHGVHREGTWELHGNTLTVRFNKRAGGTARWDGQAFVDDENKRWIRPKAVAEGTTTSTITPSTSPIQVSAADVAMWRSRIDSARDDARKMPPYNGEWQSFLTLKLSGSLDSYNQLYLAAVNRRSLALDQLVVSDSWLSRGDTAHTKSAWEKAVRLTIDSNDLVHAANDSYMQGVSNTSSVLKEVYQLSSTMAADLGYAACGQPCYNWIDVATLLSDYAVDSAIQGKAGADNNFIKSAVIKAILHSAKMDDAIAARVTHFVGQPDSAYVLVDQILKQPQFKQQIMTAIGRSAEYLTGSALSAAADQIWQALVTINRSCGSINLPAPKSETSKTTKAEPASTNN